LEGLVILAKNPGFESETMISWNTIAISEAILFQKKTIWSFVAFLLCDFCSFYNWGSFSQVQRSVINSLLFFRKVKYNAKPQKHQNSSNNSLLLKFVWPFALRFVTSKPLTGISSLEVGWDAIGPVEEMGPCWLQSWQVLFITNPTW
jgi:hypothetical protein